MQQGASISSKSDGFQVERRDHLMSDAVQAAQRGAVLTQRMLAFARRQDLRPEAVDIKAMVDAMRDMLDRSLGSYGSNLFIHFSPTMGSVLVDPTQLEMAVLNLALNARDAMPNGGPITIAAREETLSDLNIFKLPAGRYVALSVADRGEGMDAATLARATEPFFTTKGVGKGTGLGLPMVHGLAEQSGGRLVLESKPAKGTTATLWLPVDERTVERDMAEVPAEQIHAPPRPLQVLAVDDDALVLLNTASMLEDMGHSVATAYSAAQALDLLRGDTAFDLLVTDQSMPGMTGAQLVEVLRKEGLGLPVLLVTGYAELPSGTATNVPRLGKPFQQADLARAVQTLVR
jgi:CheY-like chemotaxis protein